MYLDSYGRIHFDVYDGSHNPYIIGSTGLLPNTDYQIAVVRNHTNGVLKLYIDGVEDGSTTDTTWNIYNQDSYLYLGVSYGIL